MATRTSVIGTTSSGMVIKPAAREVAAPRKPIKVNIGAVLTAVWVAVVSVVVLGGLFALFIGMT